MPHKQHLAAINAIIAVTDTKRTMTISQEADELFTVCLEARHNQRDRSATAPQLCHALTALEYLDDGETVMLDVSGKPLTEDVPARWPSEGLRAATLAKYG